MSFTQRSKNLGQPKYILKRSFPTMPDESRREEEKRERERENEAKNWTSWLIIGTRVCSSL